MRGFRFRAEAALQLRRREHEQAVMQLARAREAQAEAVKELTLSEQAMRTAESDFLAALTQPVTTVPREWYRSWRTRCAADVQRERQRVTEHDAALERAAHRVTESYKRVKALERLRESALAAWQHEVQREEQKTMDALAASKFVRRKDAW